MDVINVYTRAIHVQYMSLCMLCDGAYMHMCIYVIRTQGHYCVTKDVQGKVHVPHNLADVSLRKCPLSGGSLYGCEVVFMVVHI